MRSAGTFAYKPARVAIRAVLATLLLALCGLPAPVQAARAPFRTVVIDAGHGGHDRGGIPGQRVAEKEVALDVAKRLETILRERGFRTVMTRRSDVFLSLGHRVAIANSQKDAIFVSVHFNSAKRAGASGVETYYYTSNSAGLAARIHREMARPVSTEDRGLRRRGFYVVRRTLVPSVLVECGFLTNPREAQLARKASYRQDLAERIARGIIAHYNATGGRPIGGGISAAR
jgi:N-acetylmuramoyl-L-alanine amidase